MWETPLYWNAKCSFPVAVHVIKTSVLKLLNFGQGEDFQANHGTVPKSALFPQPGNQKRRK